MVCRWSPPRRRPRDIQARCDNGLLVDATDAGGLQMLLNGPARIQPVGAAGGQRWRPSAATSAGMPTSAVIGLDATAPAFSGSGSGCLCASLQSPVVAAVGSGQHLEVPDGADLAEVARPVDADGERCGLGIVTGRSLAAPATLCRTASAVSPGVDQSGRQ